MKTLSFSRLFTRLSRCLALRASAAASLVAVLVISSPALAAPSAKAHLKRRHATVSRVLAKPDRTDAQKKARQQKLDQLLGALLDYDELSRRALDDHWDEQSPAEREKFVKLLGQLVQRSYQQNLTRTLDYSVKYLEEKPIDGERVLVRTAARSKKNRRAPAVTIDYRLHRVEGEWKVYDIITDGVSMVDNYRGQFDRIISREGWNELISRMTSRLSTEGTVL